MSLNIINKQSFIRTSRSFPKELNQLAVEVNQAYTDIASSINSRTIGVYCVNFPANTGNVYFLDVNRQQSFRQVYTFISTSFPINLGFKLATTQIVQMYGNYTDGTNVYGLIQASSVAIAGQISFYLSQTIDPKTDTINFVVDVGAPILTSGIIIIEWT